MDTIRLSNSSDLAWFVDLLWIFFEICQLVNISQQIHMLEAQSVYQKIIFLISQPKHMLWVLERTVSMRRFF